ncbi:MAG: lipoate--protein ligase family protein [Sulfurospirillum sp.]|nr:lipoate--protein ligase family protein [Sulfurospirillum sp.]
MFRNTHCRLIIQGKNDAATNMASDEALLNCFDASSFPTLRLYHWNQSFSIGVSQDFDDYDFCDAFGGDYAKRITGGGVLFHGHDLSYALIIPALHVSHQSIKQSYEKICSFILVFYQKLGLKAIYAKDSLDITLSKNPFCQIGFEAYDILIDGKKVGGNAQRRVKKAIFQHGSIPLFRPKNSPVTQEKIGISLEDFDLHVSYETASELLAQAFEESFSTSMRLSKLSQEEEEEIQRLLKEKYGRTR